MEIVRPTLLLDVSKCRQNILQMADRARKANVSLRPHFKTHQSHEVGRWFRESGANKCTVSSVRMASYFAEDGWDDITVAFPLNGLEAGEINRLARSCKLNLGVVSTEAIQILAAKLDQPVSCVIEIDTGYRRTGIDWENYPAIDEVLSFISNHPLLSFKGFFCHAGQSYSCRSVTEILKVHEDTMSRMGRVGDHYRKKFPHLELSVGDTPTCSLASEFKGIDELRPGNYVFYDVMQTVIGSCTHAQVAVAMACPVVAVYRERNEIIIHGGAVHFSKDSLKNADGTQTFGQVAKLGAAGWGPPLALYIKSLSQEHGIIHVPGGDFQGIRVGDVIAVLPIHSCLTADAMGEYTTLQGEIVSMM